MANFITQESIDEVSNRVDIVSIVGEYVSLTRKGNDFWGCCPFHHEKTPSFSVSSDKKFYYCFGCHEGGNAFKFIQQMEKLSYPESIEFLAKKCGVSLKYTQSNTVSNVEQDKTAKLKQEYVDLYNRVATSFQYFLMETPQGKFALNYIKDRGLTDETLKKFKIGYSPADPKWLKQFLLKKNYSEEFLAESGLFSKKHPDYSFFTDRLMFPIFDRKGDVVALGGRFLRGDKEKSPKYLNSGDLIQYKKGSTLYAFNFAKTAIRENKKVIFCEGYMDCIAYHQCGINYAVAPLGTALTEDQIRIVKPFVDCVLLSFDSDGAGQKATIRAINMIRKENLQVKIIILKGGKDPAEIMNTYGSDYLTNEVNSAILDNDFLLSKLLEVYPKDSPDGKVKASQEYFTYIDSLQSDVLKSACLEKFSQAYEIKGEAVLSDFNNHNKNSVKIRNPEPVKKEITSSEFKSSDELRAVLTVVTEDSADFDQLRRVISIEDLQDNFSKQLFSAMEDCFESDNFSVNAILIRIQNNEFQNWIISTLKEYESKEKESAKDGIKYLQIQKLKRRQNELLDLIENLQNTVTVEGQKKMISYITEKNNIDKQLNSLKGIR